MACSPQVVDKLNIQNLELCQSQNMQVYEGLDMFVDWFYAGKIGEANTSSSKWQLDSYPFNHLQPISSLIKQMDQTIGWSKSSHGGLYTQNLEIVSNEGSE